MLRGDLTLNKKAHTQARRLRNAPLFPLRAIRFLASHNTDKEWLDVPVGAAVHDREKSNVLEETQEHEGDAFRCRSI